MALEPSPGILHGMYGDYTRLSVVLAALRLCAPCTALQAILQGPAWPTWNEEEWPNARFPLRQAYPMVSGSNVKDAFLKLMVFDEKQRHQLIQALAHTSQTATGTREDIAIRCGLALEWLLTGDSSTELQFRLQVRSSKLIGGSSEMRRSTAELAKIAYNARSRAAHFSTDKAARTALSNMEGKIVEIREMLRAIAMAHADRGRFPKWETEVDFDFI
ncbi:MAG: hypothetical protein HEQ38_04885 [Gemmatimonas sp.]|nr:hypothetical protein [Gemmatimonas sp.]